MSFVYVYVMEKSTQSGGQQHTNQDYSFHSCIRKDPAPILYASIEAIGLEGIKNMDSNLYTVNST